MPQPSSVLALAVETKADPASLADLARKTHKALSDAMRKSAKQTTKLMGLALQQAASGGMFTRGLVMGLRGAHKKITDHLAKSTEEGARQGLGKAALWMGDKMAGMMQEGQQKLERSWAREKKRREAAARELKDFRDKEVDEQIDRYSQGIGGAAAALTGALRGGDLKGLADLVRGAGTGIRQRGRAAAAAGADPEAGMGKKLLGVMGGFAAKLGTAVAAIGALAGGIALVVKVLMDVEAVAKDMNKAFIESGGAINAALGAPAETADELNRQLRTAQEFMTDTELSKQWHVSSEEIQGVVKGLNESGMSARRLTEGIKSSTMQMKALRDATELALGYGLLLGKSSGEMADNMGKVAFETGTTLQRVAEGMSSVAAIAKEAGFDTKRFYAAVLEATTGMGMYNVRIEQAAGLLKTLSNVLGETVAGEFLKSINQTFTDDAMTEKWKHAVLGGMQDMMGLMLEDAADEQRAIARDLESMLEGKGVDQERARAVEKWFGPVEDMAKRFAKMSRQDFAERTAAARAAGVDAEMLNQINRMFELAQGGAGRGRTVMAMGQMDPMSKLIHRMREAERVTGLQDLTQATDKHLAAIEAAVGLSGKNLQMLLRVQQDAKGDFAQLRKIAKGTSELNEEQKQAILKMYNVTAEGGKIREKETGKLVRNVEDLLMASEQFAEVASKQDVAEDIQLAREISQATKTTANVVKNLMLKALLEIAANTGGALQYIKQIIELMSFFMPGERRRARDIAARTGARAMLESGAAAAESQAAILGEELAMLGQELQALGIGPEAKERREAIKKEVELKSKQKEALDEYARAQKEAIPAIDDVVGMYDKASDVARMALGGETEKLTGVGTRVGPGGKVATLMTPEAMAADMFKRALDEVDEAWFTDDLFSEVFDPEGDAADQMQELRDTLLRHFSEEEVEQMIGAARRRAAGVVGGEEGVIDVKADRLAAAQAFGEEIAKQAEMFTRQRFGAGGAVGVGAEGARHLVEGIAAEAKQGQDFIITKQGEFIQSSPGDTIIGTRGGAGMAAVQVNIYGGDKREVYSTVREAIRASQKATA